MTKSKALSNALDDAILGLSCYYLTTFLVLLGVVFGQEFVMTPGKSFGDGRGQLGAFLNWDGQHYKTIVERGYSYDPNATSSIAFFPAYPLVARFFAQITGCSTDVALLSVAHLFLAAAFVLLATYVRSRYSASAEVSTYTLVAFGLFPTTFFFRMGYTESMFICFTVFFMLAIEKRWPFACIAFLAGLTTAIRPVAVALVPVFLWDLWSRRKSPSGFIVQMLAYLPLACWGLLAFMIFQFLIFDEPFAFVKAQNNWRMHADNLSMEKPEALIKLEPLWGLYDSTGARYWERYEGHHNYIFSLIAANPVILLSAILLIIVGTSAGWLTRYEIVLVAGLVVIPYATRAYEMSMASTGRFVAVIFPIYLVLGNLLGRAPLALATTTLAASGFFLGAYSALFICGYRLF
jgi:hypothetical protein